MFYKNSGRKLLASLLVLALCSTAPSLATEAADATTAPAAGLTSTPDSFTADLPNIKNLRISADSSSFNEDTGRYVFTGNVSIQIGPRLIKADQAQMDKSLQIWAQGAATLTYSEYVFQGDALYVQSTESLAYFFGHRCGMKRPGLAIHSDSMTYDWSSQLVTFTGHVFYVSKDGKEHAATSLVYDIANNKIR